LELGHDDLALYAELLSELVYPDLRHCTPLLAREAGYAVRTVANLTSSSPRAHQALIAI
jgi:hypothetical protein